MSEAGLQLVAGGRDQAPAEGELDDDDLMRLVQAGRQDAFARLIGRHQRLVVGLAVRYLADAAAGRDAAQDVFLALWAERHRYRPRGRFRSYLVSMTLNRCHSLARSRRRRRRKHDRFGRLDAGAGSAGVPLDELLRSERARRVRALLGRLPHKQRAALSLRYGQGLSLEEIARLTEQPLGTVKSHLFRGMRRLKRLLDKGGWR